MEEYQTQIQYFKILMHPTRLAILEMLRGGEQCVCHMEAVLGLRQAHISQHLMAMREAELVVDRRDGWNIFYRVCRPEIYTVIDAMNAFTSSEDVGNLTKGRKSMKEMACPCPKCSSRSDTLQQNSPDLAVEMAKAAD